MVASADQVDGDELVRPAVVAFGAQRGVVEVFPDEVEGR